MRYSRAVVPLLALGLALALPSQAPATEPTAERVTVNGVELWHAVSSLEVTVDVEEYRDGSQPNVVRLIPGAKRYNVCIGSPVPLKMLDEELPLSDMPDRFTVKVEDGRELSSCLLGGLNQATRPRERVHDRWAGKLYRYCLRCEDITLPAP